MYCSNCGTVTSPNATFCPNCGTSVGAGASRQGSYVEGITPEVVGAPRPGQMTYPDRPEEKSRRVVAYLIDLVPMLLLAVVHLLPIFGWMLYGFLHACYWLLRDVGGASPGKMVIGSMVGSENGRTASTSQRILRNLPLAIPGVLGMIPLIGIFFEFTIAVLIFGGEALLLLATGRRLGDRLAGTNVFRNQRVIQ